MSGQSCMTAGAICLQSPLLSSLHKTHWLGSCGRSRASSATASSRGHCRTTSMSSVKGCTFEVFGKVQGVFFRDATKRQADSLNVVGWCRNTTNSTVAGEIQGEPAPFYEMKEWLKHEGSPASKIEDCKFGAEQEMDSPTHKSFDIVR